MEGEMQEVDAWQGRAGEAGLQELAELECLCAQGMRKRLGFPSYAVTEDTWMPFLCAALQVHPNFQEQKQESNLKPTREKGIAILPSDSSTTLL